MKLLTQDPITASWMLALLMLFITVVAIPLLRAIAASLIYGYAFLTGRHHLRATAARVMPKLGRLMGSLVVGVASVAAPAAAAPTAVSTVSVDRDGGVVSVETQRPAVPAVEQQSAATQPDESQHSESAQPATALYVVKTGDSLWSIAASQLQSPTDAEITAHWKAIWRANRKLIGDQPEFIRPGMELRIGGVAP